MKKNIIMLVLMFVLCVGLFMPKNTFALQVYNNVNIDYRFFVDEDDGNVGNLKFKLYDKSGTLNFESKYDSSTKQYYFEYDENGFYKESSYYNYYIYWWNAYDWGSYEANYREYVPYVDEFREKKTPDSPGYGFYYTILSESEFHTFLQNHQLLGSYDNSWGGHTWTFYTYVPMIIENVETGIKKIVFASLNVRDDMFVHLVLINNTVKTREELTSLGDSFLDNVDFMRKTMLDYSDELWEELNNGPIASSEIYSDNIASTNYKYINQSINGGTRNVPEETLEDYASSLPVLSFKKVDSTDEDKDNNTKNNIVNVIINPKTWNNGVVILVISMIVIIGSSIVLIKRKSN